MMKLRLPTPEELRKEMQSNSDKFEKGVIYWTSTEMDIKGEECAAAIHFNLTDNPNFDESYYNKKIGYEKNDPRVISIYISIIDDKIDKENLTWIISLKNNSINWYDSMNEIRNYQLSMNFL